MPIALRVIAVLYASGSGVVLVLTLVAFGDYGKLSAGLARSGITLPVFLLINVAVPVAIIAARVGLSRGARWGWWLIATVAGAQVLNKLALAFVAPRALLGAYPVLQNISLIIAVATLAYLFSNSIFRGIHEESIVRRKALGILALVCVAVSALYQWQASVSREVSRSNISLQPTPKSGAAELKR
jgi:hypothetical protein